MKLFFALLFSTAAFAQPVPSIFVVNKAADSVSIVNARTLKGEHTIPVGRNPHELAVAPDASKMVVPNAGGNSVSVIDLKTRTESKIMDNGFDFPHGAAFTPDSRRVI